MMATLVSNRIRPIIGEKGRARLEESCGPGRRDWIKLAPAQSGIERIEAFFGGHAYDPHRHDTYAVGYTLGGVQSFDYRGMRFDSIAGHAIVLHPDERHDGRAGAEGGFRYRMLYLAPHLIRAALGETTKGLPFVRQAVLTSPGLMQALALGLGELDRRLEELEVDRLVLAVAEALLALDPAIRRKPAAANCATAVERARQFIDAHSDRIVASQALELISGLDRYTLARHFRARLGTSPYRYLVLRRLERARSLMLAGHPLAEAALASGFADQSHMTRAFKQTYGLPPGRWRAIQRDARPTAS